LLLNGQVVRGGGALAGEFGHVTLDENGPVCPCGKRGCFERYASNSAALKYWAENTNRPKSKRTATTFADLLRLAEGGDRRAVEALERMAYFLGVGLAALATGLSPRVSPPIPARFSLTMLGETPGGDTYMFAELRQQLEDAGFHNVSSHALPTPQMVLLAEK